MKAYDYKAFVKENMDSNGAKFLDNGLFHDASSCWWGVWNGRGKVYSFTLCYVKWIKRKPHSVYVTLSQNGLTVEADDKAWSFDEVFSIVSKLKEGLEKHSFVATAYELWSDHPDVPYYIPAEKRSLCGVVVDLEDGDGDG